MTEKIRVVILEDHPSVIEGYKSRLDQAPDLEIVGTASVVSELEPLLQSAHAHVLLLDLRAPLSRNSEEEYPIFHFIPRWLETYPDLQVLVISMYAERALIRAVRDAGASGYMLKNDVQAFQDLPAIVRRVARGDIYFSERASAMLTRPSAMHLDETQLSPRQIQALSLCAAYPTKRIADLARLMNIENSSVRNLLSKAYLNLGVSTRAEAVAKAQALGVLPHD